MNINRMTQKQLTCLKMVKEYKDPILWDYFRNKNISKFIRPGIYTKDKSNVIFINDAEEIKDLIGYIKKNKIKLFSIIPKDHKILMIR